MGLDLGREVLKLKESLPELLAIQTSNSLQFVYMLSQAHGQNPS